MRLFDPDDSGRPDAVVSEPSYAAPAAQANYPEANQRANPRAKLLLEGAEALDDDEVLALLLGGSVERARSLISAFGGLWGLGRASVADLSAVGGVGEARAASVLAAAELGRRMARAAGSSRPVVSSPRDVDALLRPRIAHLDREHLVVLLLNTKNRVISSPTVSVGTLTQSLVHPREVFKPAIRASAASVVLAYNHPSGDSRPSAEDVAVTKRLARVGREAVGIGLLDHIVIGDGFTSLKEAGHL